MDISFNVRDIYGNFLNNANVVIDCNGQITSGLTDVNGCFYEFFPLQQICNLTITKENYTEYNSKIILIPESDMNDTANQFICKVIY